MLFTPSIDIPSERLSSFTVTWDDGKGEKGSALAFKLLPEDLLPFWSLMPCADDVELPELEYTASEDLFSMEVGPMTFGGGGSIGISGICGGIGIWMPRSAACLHALKMYICELTYGTRFSFWSWTKAHCSMYLHEPFSMNSLHSVVLYFIG